MAIKASPRKRIKHRKPTGVEKEPPRFAWPQSPCSPSPSDSADTHETTTRRNGHQTAEEDDAAALTVPTCILPPHLAHLMDSYSVATMSLISSSKIEQKVKVLLKHLERFSFGKIDAKPGVVALHAKAPVANKMISVIEITKRTIKGGKLYQYSRLSEELTTLKIKDEKPDESKQLEAEEDSDSAFETMTIPKRPKVRAVPMLTVYLARVPVVELADEFGQQTTG